MMRVTADTWPETGISRRRLLGGGAALLGSSLLDPCLARAAIGPQGGWANVADLISRYVDRRKLPGIVATIGRGDESFSTIARGATTFGGHDRVGPDNLFRIYSMTKPVTGLLAAILIDEGRLALDEPLADSCPEFATMQVATDPMKGLGARPATSQITVRHLLTHTAGLGYAVVGRDRVSAEMLRRGLVAGAITRRRIKGVTSEVPVPGPDAFLAGVAQLPLLADPGARWIYSMSLDVLGLAIARKLGRPLEQLLAEQILGPAGMTSTWFRVPDAEAARLVTNYGFSGGFHAAIDRPTDSVFRDAPPFAAGGAGLVSSPRDFDRFMRIILDEGRIGGQQVISPAAVRLAVSNLLPPGASLAGTAIAGAGFGAGARVGLGNDEGSYGWSGAAGTIFLVQRRVRLRAALYAQFMPVETFALQQEFLKALHEDYQAGLTP